jgi:hypothetical protein
MKKILSILLLLLSFSIYGQKLAQLERCKINGVIQDSCCIISGPDGHGYWLPVEACKAIYADGSIEITIGADSTFLIDGVPLQDFCNAIKKCETKVELINLANGTYQFVNEAGVVSVMGYSFTCVNDSTIQLRDHDGTLVNTCVIRGAATPPVPIAIDTLIVESDSTLTVGTTDGNQYTLDLCNLVKKCETNIIVLNNADGTYAIINENGFPTVLGYRLQCVNDSTIAITDNDGTLINQCMLKGGANPSVPIAIDTLIIASDSTVTVRTTDGNEYTLDLCNVVKKCETATNIVWNTSTNEYYYTNEKGDVDTVSFSIGWNPVTEEIYHINHNGDTTSRISACDLVCTNTVSATDDNYSTNDCTIPYCSNVLVNDMTCVPGPTTSIALVGMPQNGTVTIDVNGNFCFTFLSCDPTDPFGFTYQITCPDGTTTTAIVTIDLISTCPSNAALEDFVLAFKNTATNFNVAINDLACTDKTYTLFTNPANGTVFFNPNGSGIYNPNSGYMGLDSCIVELHCNGQSCDTSWLKFLVLENAPADSTYYLFAGQTITGDASLNDPPCTPPSTTSFAWVNSLMPSYAGTLTGIPTAWTYVSSPSYCGDSYREYEQICTPPGAPGTKAKEMFKSVCASGVPDFVTILDDTTGTFNVSSNDLSCTNGAATTWHLFQDPAFSGTKTHGNANDTIWLYKCKGNCPVTNPSPSDKIGHIHSWDTLTGAMSYYIPPSYDGDLCFKYIMRCRLPYGNWQNDDTVCVSITREKSFLNFVDFNTSDTSVNYDYTVVPRLSIEYDVPQSCLNGTEYLQICMRVSPDDRVSKGFGTQVCLANIVGITNIQNFITALNGTDLRTWLVGKSVNILEQNFYDATVATTAGTKTVVSTAPTGVQISLDRLACAHIEFTARIVTTCVTVTDTLLIELPRIRYEGALTNGWMASAADTYRPDPYGIPPYTAPTNFSMLNASILDLYSYIPGVNAGGNHRCEETLVINGVSYIDSTKQYYDYATIKADILAASIPNYIGLYLDLYYGGNSNLNGGLGIILQLCGADKTIFGTCSYVSNTTVTTVENTLANNTVAKTPLLAGCYYNMSRQEIRVLYPSVGLAYLSSHTP